MNKHCCWRPQKCNNRRRSSFRSELCTAFACGSWNFCTVTSIYIPRWMWHLYYVNTEGCRTAKRLKKQTTIFFGRSKILASMIILYMCLPIQVSHRIWNVWQVKLVINKCFHPNNKVTNLSVWKIKYFVPIYFTTFYQVLLKILSLKYKDQIGSLFYINCSY